MGKTTDEIATEIDHTREHLRSNLEELESRVKAVTDWRTQFRKHPGRMIMAALAGGVLLSSMFATRPGSSQGDSKPDIH